MSIYIVFTEDYKLIKITTKKEIAITVVDSWNGRKTSNAFLDELDEEDFLFEVSLFMHTHNTPKEIEKFILEHKVK